MKILSYKIIDTNNISNTDTIKMYDIFRKYYDSVTLTQFVEDLSKKQYCIFLFNQNQTLVGFSSIEVYDDEFFEEKLKIIFSGDTIIEQEYWGSRILPYSFGYFAGKIKKDNPNIKLYWFLISKGHRTYRYLSSFAKSYFPSLYQNKTNKLEKTLNFLANNKFSKFYDSKTNLINFEKSSGQLDRIWESKTNNKYARFFLKSNPKYFQGIELACITELCLDNLRSTTLRGFKDGLS